MIQVRPLPSGPTASRRSSRLGRCRICRRCVKALCQRVPVVMEHREQPVQAPLQPLSVRSPRWACQEFREVVVFVLLRLTCRHTDHPQQAYAIDAQRSGPPPQATRQFWRVRAIELAGQCIELAVNRHLIPPRSPAGIHPTPCHYPCCRWEGNFVRPWCRHIACFLAGGTAGKLRRVKGQSPHDRNGTCTPGGRCGGCRPASESSAGCRMACQQVSHGEGQTATTAVRVKLLQLLAEMSERCPEWRFGQTVANLAAGARQPADPHGIWDVEDEELVAALERHLAPATEAPSR